MVFRRKKNLEPMVWFYRKNKFFFEPMIDTVLSVKNEKFLTDGSILLVASMTDSIDW